MPPKVRYIPKTNEQVDATVAKLSSPRRAARASSVTSFSSRTPHTPRSYALPQDGFEKLRAARPHQTPQIAGWRSQASLDELQQYELQLSSNAREASLHTPNPYNSFVAPADNRPSTQTRTHRPARRRGDSQAPHDHCLPGPLIEAESEEADQGAAVELLTLIHKLNYHIELLEAAAKAPPARRTKYHNDPAPVQRLATLTPKVTDLDRLSML